MVSVTIYVEGGGDAQNLRTECRQAFSSFFKKAGFVGRMPRIVASGGRDQAYQDFCIAHQNSTNDEIVILLVDSEEDLPQKQQIWEFLAKRDGWQRPDGAIEEQVHCMVQCMEAWFLADHNALSKYYGKEFNAKALPNRSDVENIPKNDLFLALKNASRQCQKKGQYDKGGHSFEILGALNPNEVIAKSYFAKRLIDYLNRSNPK